MCHYTRILTWCRATGIWIRFKYNFFKTRQTNLALIFIESIMFRKYSTSLASTQGRTCVRTRRATRQVPTWTVRGRAGRSGGAGGQSVPVSLLPLCDVVALWLWNNFIGVGLWEISRLWYLVSTLQRTFLPTLGPNWIRFYVSEQWY